MEENIEIQWKDVPNYEGKYKISSEGNIYNTLKNFLAKISYDRDGYRVITLNIEGKGQYKRISRLVMHAFHGDSDLQVDHINTIKDDDRLANLRYVTPRKNSQYRTENKRGFVGVKFIKGISKWKAIIYIEKVYYTLGLYEAKEDGIKVYNDATYEWVTFKILPKKYTDPNKTSIYKGIYYSKKFNKWFIDYTENGKRYSGGCLTEQEANTKLKNMIENGCKKG